MADSADVDGDNSLWDAHEVMQDAFGYPSFSLPYSMDLAQGFDRGDMNRPAATDDLRVGDSPLAQFAEIARWRIRRGARKHLGAKPGRLPDLVEERFVQRDARR